MLVGFGPLSSSSNEVFSKQTHWNLMLPFFYEENSKIIAV